MALKCGEQSSVYTNIDVATFAPVPATVLPVPIHADKSPWLPSLSTDWRLLVLDLLCLSLPGKLLKYTLHSPNVIINKPHVICSSFTYKTNPATLALVIAAHLVSSEILGKHIA